MKLDVLYNAVQYTNVSQPGFRKLCVKGQRVVYLFLMIFLEALSFLRNILPNVLVECLAHLLRIWHIPGSNLGTETAILSFFVVFVSTSRRMPV